MGNTDYDQILNIYREKQDYKYVEVIILEKMAINTSVSKKKKNKDFYYYYIFIIN